MDPAVTQAMARWRRPWWVKAHWLLLAWCALVAYGTLLPFQFDFRPLTGLSFMQAAERVITSPRWPDEAAALQSETTSDLIVNLLLFMPAGALLRRALRARGIGAWSSLAIAAPLVLALAWCIESLQSLIPMRVPSISDALLNGAGAALGALVGETAWRWTQSIIFAGYKELMRCAPVGSRRHLPAVATMLALNGLGLLLWYALMLPSSAPVISSDGLPFMGHFHLRYDEAALWLGRSLTIYLLLAAAVSLRLISRGSSRPILKLVIGTIIAALAVDMLRHRTLDLAPSSTELVLAVAAAFTVAITLTLLVHIIRASCRRRAAQPVDIERRRRAHDYRFALHRR